MKKCCFFIFLTMVLSIGILQATGLKVSESMVDFGTIKEGPPVVKTVVLTNNGTGRLLIKNVKAS